MAWRRILLWTTTSVLIVGVALVVFLLSVDLGFLKPYVERGITDATGRDFSIGGDLSVRLGGHARIVAHDIRLQDAGWSDTAEMLRIGRIDADVDLFSLFGNGPLVIERIAVRDARVRLARNEAGESNWSPGEPGAEDHADGDGRKILLRQLDVARVCVTLERPGQPEPLELQIASLRQDVGDDDMLSTSLEATVNARKLSASGRLGTWTALLERGRIDYQLEAHLDRVRLTSEGFIDSLAAPRRPDLSFSLNGPSIADLYVMAGLGEHGAGDVNLQGSLAPGTNDGPLELRIEGNAGETRVDATGTISDLQDLEHLHLEATATGPNLGRILGVFGVLAVSEVPFALSLDVQRDGPQLTIRESTLDIGDATAVVHGQLPEFPGLGNATASARVEGPAIERLKRLAPIPAGIRGPFVAELEIDATGGRSEAYRALLRTTLGELSVAGTLGPAPEHFGSRANVRFTGDSVAAIAAAWDFKGAGAVPVSLTGDLEYGASGIRLRDTVLSANEHQARIDGIVGINGGLDGTALALRIEGDSLAGLGTVVYPVDGLPSQPYTVELELRADDRGYRAPRISAAVGDAELSGEALVTRMPDLDGSRAALSVEGPALERLVPALGTRRVRPGPFSLSGEVAIAGDRLKLEQLRVEREFAAVSADAEVGWPLSFDVASFDVRGEGDDVRALIGHAGPLQLAALPYELALSGSRRGSHWQVETLDAKLGDARAHASGSVDYGESMAASRLEVRVQIPGLASLGTIDGRPLRDRSVILAGRIVGRETELAAEDLSLTIDEGTIGGDVRFRPGAVPEVHADLRSESFTLHPLQEEVEGNEPAVERADGRLIPDVPVDLGMLSSFSGTLHVEIGTFRRDVLRLRNLALDATLSDGELQLSRFRLEGKTGRLDATASIGAGNDVNEFSISLTARDFGLGLDETNTDNFLIADIDARLASSGDALRSIAGNLDGFVFVDSKRGRVRNYRALQAIYGDLLDEMLSTINPFYRAGEYTDFECIVLPLEIADGRVQSAPGYLVMTDKVQIMSQSTIELDTEAIDMNIRTLPRKTLGISAAEIVNPYVKIVGTLGAPRLTLDQKGMLVTGGAAVATGGLSVLAKAAWDRFDRLSRDADPCEEAAAAAKVGLANYLERE